MLLQRSYVKDLVTSSGKKEYCREFFFQVFSILDFMPIDPCNCYTLFAFNGKFCFIKLMKKTTQANSAFYSQGLNKSIHQCNKLSSFSS